jgi:ribosomal protein L37AE/L43A
MGWVTRIHPDPHSCPDCRKRPDSEHGRAFAKGSLWDCDTCGRRWEFHGFHDDQRDPRDDWKLYQPPVQGSFH